MKIKEIDHDFICNNSQKLLKHIWYLEAEYVKWKHKVKSENGVINAKMEDILKCWEKYFLKHLIISFPHEECAMDYILLAEADEWDRDVTVTDSEIERPLKQLKAEKCLESIT